jgi:multiple sugar transport system ATP-binding protein
VEVGIRPEDIEVVHKPENAFRAVVEMISNVGSEKYIHAHLGSTILTVRATKEETFKPGETIHLVIHPLKLHIFYKGKRI